MGSLWIVTRRAYLHRFGAPRSVFAFFRNMSYQAAVSKLNSPVKELVLAVAGTSTDLAGTSQADEAEVASWIEKTSQGDLVKADKLKVCNDNRAPRRTAEKVIQDLDTLLVPKTYIATNYFTVADVALYGALHSVVVRASLCYLGRYIKTLCRPNSSHRSIMLFLPSPDTLITSSPIHRSGLLL